MIRIALDFDGTFTADAPLWARFIRDAQSRGHSVWIVTARRDTAENRETIDAAIAEHSLDIGVIYCALGSKLHCVERRGLKIDVWIDDDPETLVQGH